METLDPFLPSAVASLDESYVPKTNRNEFAHLKFLYNFYFLNFSIGRVLMILAIPSGKNSKLHKVYTRFNVTGFDGSFDKFLSIFVVKGELLLLWMR
jgi:hypothetical protein